MRRNTRSFDIALTGIGVGGFEQTTLETLNAFKAARVIFHLTSYHNALAIYCNTVINLAANYWTGELDTKVYKTLANLILAEATKAPGVVVVGDGNPAYYDDVTWDIYRRGKKRGLLVKIMPAISCLDSMAANCGLEINAAGLQIFDATTMVAINQEVNPYIDTLIMQPGWFGTSLLFDISHSRRGRFRPLVNHLKKFYPRRHPIRLLRAPYTSKERPKVLTTTVFSLDSFHKTIWPDMSLFLPALDHINASCSINKEFVRQTVNKKHLRDIAVIRE